MFQALNPQYGHYCGAPPQSGARNKPSTLTHFGHFYQIRLLKDEWSQNVKFKKNIFKKKKKEKEKEKGVDAMKLMLHYQKGGEE